MFQSSVKRQYERRSAGNRSVESDENEISGGKDNSSIAPNPPNQCLLVQLMKNHKTLPSYKIFYRGRP